MAVAGQSRDTIMIPFAVCVCERWECRQVGPSPQPVNVETNGVSVS